MRTVLLAVISVVALIVPSLHAADTLPRELSDDAYWKLIADYSEEAGSFRFEYMSNEQEFQIVIPRLLENRKPGGVYVGVGPEQNFTYIAALQPKMAFIVDIRRENMLEHLIYKAAFETSANRAEFLSKLFSRKVPAGVTNATQPTTSHMTAECRGPSAGQNRATHDRGRLRQPFEPRRRKPTAHGWRRHALADEWCE